MRVIQGQGAGKGSGIGFLKEVLKVEAGLGAGKSRHPSTLHGTPPHRK
jgi:hypothetical protein